MAAEVTETKANDSKEIVVPNLMTRVRIEHELEALRRDRETIEKAIAQQELEAEKKQLPVHEALLKEKQSEIRGLTEKIEVKIKELKDLNKGINTEEPEKEKKIG